MSRALQVVPLDRSLVTAASQVLARAFQNDPLQAWVLPDEEVRSMHSQALFSALVLYSQLSGHVWTTKGIDGVSAWLSPGYVHTNEISAQSGFSRLPELIGANASGKYMRFVEHMEMIRSQAMPGPHWYGVIIGVNPRQRGKGIAGSLLQPVLDLADRNCMPCYLETCQPKNLRFYSSHGFRVVAEGSEMESGLRYWRFRRNPQSLMESANST